MRWVISLVVTAILALVLQQFMPWWSIAVAAGAVGLLLTRGPWESLITGFLAISLYWFAYAFWIDHDTGQILTTRIAQLFGLSGPWPLMVMTGLTGGLCGAMACLAGYSFRKLF